MNLNKFIYLYISRFQKRTEMKKMEHWMIIWSTTLFTDKPTIIFNNKKKKFIE